MMAIDPLGRIIVGAAHTRPRRDPTSPVSRGIMGGAARPRLRRDVDGGARCARGRAGRIWVVGGGVGGLVTLSPRPAIALISASCII